MKLKRICPRPLIFGRESESVCRVRSDIVVHKLIFRKEKGVIIMIMTMIMYWLIWWSNFGGEKSEGPMFDLRGHRVNWESPQIIVLWRVLVKLGSLGGWANREGVSRVISDKEELIGYLFPLGGAKNYFNFYRWWSVWGMSEWVSYWVREWESGEGVVDGWVGWSGEESIWEFVLKRKRRKYLPTNHQVNFEFLLACCFGVLS
jgi:hypothetical protein